ncbi:glycosyl transferase [Kocuria dechangensis]|uniref:Glycosyl transferase n=1 Tax=Kocuria dechangensis TaxID=1176249 RepID=A0A917H3V8_9MICC|nr:glycosyltransferase family 4 protein [Kocuria dechangensis]GGG66755.1 glycosyl transferase [Kocuria dechangensis]
MHIGLIVAPWFPIPPVAYGGIELVVDALARGLTAAGHEVVLAAAADSTCPVARLPGTDPSDPVALGASWSELSHVARAYAGLAGMDVIHDHTLAGPLYRHRPPAVPVVTTIHGPLTSHLEEIYRAAGRDTAVVAISHDQISRSPGLPVAAVIPHGVDLSAVPVGRGRGGYALFLGRMTPDKGIAEAIVIARAAGVPLRIAAKMREPAELRYFHDVIEPILGPDEEFLGEVGGRQKYELLGNAVALLNPIQWPEPFGLVMIEALATGTPVVATPLGAAPEIVEPGVTGYLAETPAQLAAVLGRAAALDRRAVRASAERRFSAERMVEDHLALYTKLVADPAVRVA